MKKSLSKLFQFVTRPVVDIRSGERMKTMLMFFYFMLTIGLIYVLKPVQKSLFISEFGAENLRYANMAEGIFLILVVSLYVQFAKRAGKGFFYFGILAFFLSNLILFWFLFHLKVRYLTGVFYLWQASFSVTVTTVFWTLANDIFKANEAKRLFGFIISGGSLGGILGGFLTSRAVSVMDTEDLLLAAAGVLVLCILLVRILWGHLGEGTSAKHTQHASDHEEETPKEKEASIFRIFFKTRYVVMLCGLVILTKMTSTVLDNQFGGIVELAIQGRDEMTAFYGQFFGWLNTVSFLMQIFVTSLCLRYLGVGLSLWILPVGLLFLSSAGYLYPTLLVGLGIRMFDGSVNYSVQQASKEVLYLPLSSRIRRRVKPVIDMLGYRGAKTFAGLYIALVAPLFALPVEKLSLLVIFLIPLWCWIVWQMKKSYSSLLRGRLASKRSFKKSLEFKDTSYVLNFLQDEKSFLEMKQWMTHHSTYARKLAAAAYLTYTRSAKNINAARKFLNTMVKSEGYEAAKENSAMGVQREDQSFLEELLKEGLPQEIPTKQNEFILFLSESSEYILIRLGGILRDPEKPLSEKRIAVRLLELIPKQEVIDLLLHTLASVQDHAFRHIMVQAIGRLCAKNSSLAINRFLLKTEISREVRIYEMIHRLAYYQKNNFQKNVESDYVAVALKAIQDESVERIFSFLNLLYPHEMIQTIYERIVEHAEGDPMRTHAIELLSNTLETDLAILLQRVLEPKLPSILHETKIKEILRGFLRSEDRWFSFTSSFYIQIGELHKKWPEFQDFQKEHLSH